MKVLKVAAVAALVLAVGVAWRAMDFMPLHAGASWLRSSRDVPLPGSASRFDYQTVDARAHRLYISHMGAGRLVAFDTRSERVVADLPGFPSVTGVLAVPSLRRVFASAAGAGQVVAVDTGSLKVLARIPGADFPDGMAYAPAERRIFVSDESGGADLVVDAVTLRLLKRIPLGGEAGNTHYDAAAHRMLVAVQTRNQIAAINPRTMEVSGRWTLPGCRGPHGFYVDSPRRLAFVTGEGNASLLLVDLRTMAVRQKLSVGAGPDVLAFDRRWERLYVASEAGVVSIFDLKNGRLERVADYFAPAAHSVALDPATHRVFLPLKNVGGRPVLRILQPLPPAR